MASTSSGSGRACSTGHDDEVSRAEAFEAGTDLARFEAAAVAPRVAATRVEQVLGSVLAPTAAGQQ
jgi:hypothetical protein